MLFVSFVRGRIGPYSKPRKKVIDESLAEMGVRLWGLGPPQPNEEWGTISPEQGDAYDTFSAVPSGPNT